MSEKQPTNALVAQKRTVRDLISSDRTKAEIAKVLPKHLTPERMTRVALTATMKNPALLQCSPESLMNALLVCSQAGLEPDGRLAHLIPFGQQVQVIFDYKGLVTLALRGGAQAVYADQVCANDDFSAVVENGEKRISHKANWKGERGQAVCYYAVCKRNGEVDWEVMTMAEVEAIRDRSRAKSNGPWVTDFAEMAKKTVLRRMSKRWDLLPEIRDVINTDDDTPLPDTRAMARPIFDAKPAPAAVPGAENGAGVELPPAEPPTTPPPSEIASYQQRAAEQEARDRAEDAQSGGPEMGPQTPPAQSSLAAEPKKGGSFNVLKALRGLCKIALIPEGKLLEYLANMGATDGSVVCLEELVTTYESLAVAVCQQWSAPGGVAEHFKPPAKGGVA